MRIHSISNLIIIPFVAAAAYILYLGYKTSDYLNPLNYLLIPLFIIVVVLYLFAPQINHWWHKRKPPVLAGSIIRWLETYSEFYVNLSKSDQQKFRDRLSIYLESREFVFMREEKENLPEDFKSILAHNNIMMTFYQDEYLLDPYERVIVYNHPFPTPKHQYLHTVETDHEDGVIIIAMEHTIQAMLYKTKFYNVGLHGYLEAYMNIHPDLAWPKIKDSDIPVLEKISGFKTDKLIAYLGFEPYDFGFVAANYFFTFPRRFAEALPEIYSQYQKIFKSKSNEPIKHGKPLEEDKL